MLPAMEMSPASRALGTTVRGLDLGRALPAGQLAELHAVLERSYLLHFPDQALSDEEHVAFVEQFGAIAGERPGPIGFVSNRFADGILGAAAASFHIDFGFTDRPYECLSLYGLDNHALQHARPAVGVDEPRTLRRVCVGVTPDLSIFGERMSARNGAT
jgi:alpha-ketoglutarate-dependent taurine dioxygenase